MKRLLKLLRPKDEAKDEAKPNSVDDRRGGHKLGGTLLEEAIAEAFSAGDRWAAEREQRFIDGQEFSDLRRLRMYKLYQRRNALWSDWQWQNPSLAEKRRELSRIIHNCWGGLGE